MLPHFLSTISARDSVTSEGTRRLAGKRAVVALQRSCYLDAAFPWLHHVADLPLQRVGHFIIRLLRKWGIESGLL